MMLEAVRLSRMMAAWLKVDVETCAVVPLAVDVLNAGITEGPSDDEGVERDGTEADSTEGLAAAPMEVGKLCPDGCVRDLTESSDGVSEREVVPKELKEPSAEDLVDVDRSDLGISWAEIV